MHPLGGLLGQQIKSIGDANGLSHTVAAYRKLSQIATPGTATQVLQGESAVSDDGPVTSGRSSGSPRSELKVVAANPVAVRGSRVPRTDTPDSRIRVPQ